ncbi:hypothetical protein [Commensalibacter nepenthis]|uniref:Uncharacterized protein n=1 Tax=Commensalibacter nepenthis TaxID=3043872 RepID=A0ABT6Q859_9PROT|nr:hypothetical protein [Commensalibacter sp. TBRC 10068]MDI2113082.1 hypothetical protein [Commensalibacter sp. TBRC 10068]
MRYYRIEIANTPTVDAGLDDNGNPITYKDVGNTSLYVYTSHLPNGQMNPGALNVTFNIAISFLHNSANVGSFVQIQGLPLSFLSQSYDLRKKHIRIFGGMTKNYGMDKDNIGLLLNGIIVAPYGNWEGTNQTLSFYIIPSTFVDQKEIVFYWAKDQLLSAALKSSLSVTFPKHKVVVDINSTNDRKALKKEGGIYKNIENFAEILNRQKDVYKFSSAINMYVHDNTIYVTDHTLGKKIQLKTKDMVGQPTWSDNNDITVSLVLRPDININDIVVFPKESAILGVIKPSNNIRDSYFNRGLNADIKNKPIFQGEYMVLSVQHVANYKSPSPQDWITFLTLSTINAEDNVLVEGNLI